MGNHRAHRGDRRAHSASPAGADAAVGRSSVSTPAGGRRKATRPATRPSLLRALPSSPLIVGVAALAVSAGGAVAASDAELTRTVNSAGSAMAVGGTDLASVAPLARRTTVVSRDSRRDAATQQAEAALQAEIERKAAEQHAALQAFAKAAEKQSAKIKENRWVLPLDSYRITATYGLSSHLWSSVHTGLDFSAPSGTPIHSVANGVVTETGYDGSYGNKTVITLDDGTEVWYCHQTTIDVSVGDTVRGGDYIGTVGSTGNSTGPHLHLEVRPGDSPTDPFTALMEHGLTP